MARPAESRDPIVETVVDGFRSRSAKGLIKYNSTLAENKLDLYDWFCHLQEELMDAVLYIERAKMEVGEDD